jgi:hypothetical protein
MVANFGETGDVHMEGLDLIVHLADNQHYRYDGEVENVLAHSHVVAQGFDTTYKGPNTTALGRTLRFEYGKKGIIIVSFVAPISDPNKHLLVRAHEETSALGYLDLYRPLQEDMEEYGYHFDITSLSVLDQQAVIGSMFALQKKGFDPLPLIRDADRTLYDRLQASKK